jgi:hypothetical protein
MALVLHKVLFDGTHDHVELTRESWSESMRDPSVARAWGHAPDDCHSPLERLRIERGAREFTLVQQTEVPPPGGPRPEPGPVAWPPEQTPLTAKHLSEMCGLSPQECVELLRPMWKELPRQEPKMWVDEKGQGFLF